MTDELRVEEWWPAAAEPLEEAETVDGVPVLSEVRPIDRAPVGTLPAMQAAAAAVTGFVAGAVAVALMRRHSSRKLAGTPRGGARRAVDVLPVVGTQTFLIDVHLIGRAHQE